VKSWSDAALRRIALGVFALYVALLVTAVVLAPELQGRSGRTYPDANPLDVGFVITGTALAVVGLLLTWLRPRNSLGWLLAFAGVIGSAGNAGQVYGPLAYLAPEKHLPAGELVLALSAPLWIPALVLPASLVLARYPSGVVSGRWARRFDHAVVMSLVVFCAAYAASSNAITDELKNATPPKVLPDVLLAILFGGGAIMLLCGLVGTVLTTIRRMIRSAAPERQQILLLLTTTLVVILSAFLPYEWMLSVAYALIPIAIAVGVLRYHLLGIEVVVRRTLLYGTLTGLVLVIFVAVTAGLAAVLPHGPAPLVVAASLIAVGLAPVRDRIQQVVDRIIYGERDDPWSALTRLSTPLGGPADANLLPAIAEALGKALRVQGVEIRDRHDAPVGRWGELGSTHEVPLRFGGDELGSLLVGQRRGEESLGDADRRLLDAVAPLVAAVLHAVTLAAELLNAQLRLRDATESERTRLRQDLHDGLGPSLTGVGLGLEAMESATGERSADLLARLRAEVANSLDEVRRIIDDLRPGALDEHGLLNALRLRVAQVRASTALQVDLQTPLLLDVSPEVESTIFRIADEALTNVLKHSDASTCLVRLRVDDQVYLDISDDGVGLNGSRHRGVGMQSMQERAERLGGTFATHDRAPGTEISVELPLERI
jgi:signal transduction histidine kinase